MRLALGKLSDVRCQITIPIWTSLEMTLGLLRACELLEPDYLVQILKAVKHLSMNATLLEVLQNANTIEILVRILDEQSSGPHSTVKSPPWPVSRTPLISFLSRKYPTTSSRRCSIYVASTSHDRKRLRRLVSFPVSSASLTHNRLSNNSHFQFSATSQAPERLAGRCSGSRTGSHFISNSWQILTSKSVHWSRSCHG